MNNLEEAQRILDRQRAVWKQKGFLRRLYRHEFFGRLKAALIAGGPVIELGSGPGFFKESCPEALATDIVPCGWLEVVLDAHRLPFQADSVGNIVGLDVLHHMQYPLDVLREVSRSLRPGGRCILIEPWFTPLSFVVYRYFHQEDFDLSANVRARNSHEGDCTKKPFDGNQAIPYLLFGAKNRTATMADLPDFRLVEVEAFSLFSYLLSFGFKPLNVVPEVAFPPILFFERITLPLWRRWAALRVHIVLEKVKPS